MSGGLTIAQEYVFNAGDYKFMRFNPMSAKKGESLLKQFIELGRFASFQGVEKEFGKEADNVIKYILLCYDRMSPAYTQIPDVFKRKSWCALACDFDYDKNTNVFKKKYYQIMNGENERVNYAIIDLCSLFNSTAYMLLVSGYEAFYRKQRTMFEVVNDDKKDPLSLEKIRGELYKQLQGMQKDLQNLEQQYLTERNTYLVEDLYKIANEEIRKRLHLTPERRASQKGLMKDG
jgi:hypothetical protein